MVQQISHAQEMKNLMDQQEVESGRSLKTLQHFIDKEVLLRVGGRLQEYMLPYQIMHQTILPSNHHFTQLVVSAEHIRLHHYRSQLLIALLLKKYWIQQIRNLAKTDIHLA